MRIIDEIFEYCKDFMYGILADIFIWILTNLPKLIDFIDGVKEEEDDK